MGSEMCIRDRVVLDKLTKKGAPFEKDKVGDDGLAVVRGSNRTVEKMTQTMRNIFGENELKITVEANLHETDFLDINMNLRNHEHRPFRKENSTPLYSNAGSNQPRTILNEIPNMVPQGNFLNFPPKLGELKTKH